MHSFKQFMWIAFFGIVLGLSFNAFRPAALALSAEDLVTQQSAGADTLAMESPELALISFEEVDALFRKDMAVFIDARDAEDFEMGHLPAAISLTPANYRDGTSHLKFPKGMLFVLYCAGVDCELAEDLATLLAADGFRKLRIYSGGFDEWEAMGMPLESSSE
jgi:rhodanese-related sulfurtransferase